MEVYLRDECKNLLTQLKESQKCMKDKLGLSKYLENQSVHGQSKDSNLSSNFGKDITGHVNVAKDADTDLKPSYARSKLLTLTKSSTVEKNSDLATKGKENSQASESVGSNNRLESDVTISNHGVLHNSSSRIYPIDHNYDNENLYNDDQYMRAVSPTRVKKRQLIDKHTAVETRLNPKELKELDDERLLNFNYSNINVDKNYSIKSLSKIASGNEVEKLSEKSTVADPVLSIDSTSNFKSQLRDEGNDRHFNNICKDAIKPKTLLNSTDYYSLSKRGINSRVKFNTSRNEDTIAMGGDQRLLGYDWIAALLDNERNMVDQSESFFDEICDFRKAFKNECSNQFYSESPYTLVDNEPEPVVDALTEPKVRPFVVNDRLFTEPLSSDLLEDTYKYDKKGKKISKEPSKENPRFVRVSIPRSTLQTPYRVKPHRRGSFDGSDSCALMDHCLLGWENTVPSVIPPAKSLSLADDAGTQINSQTTTLAEAERHATLHNQVQWHLSRPSPQLQTLPNWKKHYMDLTLNLTLPSHLQHSGDASAMNQTSGSSSSPHEVKRKTDKMLQATYSTMYEMERLRLQRELEKGDNS